MSNGQLPNTAVSVHLYKLFIFADAYLGKHVRRTAQAGLSLVLLLPSGVFTVIILSASFRTQWIIQQSFITPPVLFCLLQYLSMVQHLSVFNHKTCGKCSSSQWLRGILLFDAGVLWTDSILNPTLNNKYVHLVSFANLGKLSSLVGLLWTKNKTPQNLGRYSKEQFRLLSSSYTFRVSPMSFTLKM